MMYKKILASCLVITLLVGCAATQTTNKNIDIQTKMSNSISLKRAQDSHKSVYIQAKNTSGILTFTVVPFVKKALKAKGYKIVDNLNQANYLLQVNILQVGEADLFAAEKAFSDGYGSTIPIISIEYKRDDKFTIDGFVNSLANITANPSAKIIDYTVIADLQISEKTTKAEKISQIEDISLKQDDIVLNKQIAAFKADCTQHQARIIAIAKQVHLTLHEMIQLSEAKLADSIVEIFQ